MTLRSNKPVRAELGRLKDMIDDVAKAYNDQDAAAMEKALQSVAYHTTRVTRALWDFNHAMPKDPVHETE